ncbi:hypothetical protein JCM10908_002395 [Rhodotorula pacifica]|uniref:uncharacterized protein n=1 Tax=Rhodotorula pacifica TaxID=1495444 RepID=UPI00316E855C
MPLRPFTRRVSATDGDLIIKKPPAPVIRRHSSVEFTAQSPQLPPIPRVSPLLDANEQDRLVHSDDSTAPSSRCSAGSSLLDDTAAARRSRYRSADEGTVFTMASSVEEESDPKFSPPPLFAQRFAGSPLVEEPATTSERTEARPVAPPLAVRPVALAVPGGEEEDDNDADVDEDGLVYIDNESSDEEEAEDEAEAASIAAGSLDAGDDLVLACGCDAGAAPALPPPVALPAGRLPWTFPRRGTIGSDREGLADEDAEDDPALIEAERILLTTPEPTGAAFGTASLAPVNLSPRSVTTAGPTKRPSLPLPELPFPTAKRKGSLAASPNGPTRTSPGGIERELQRFAISSASEDEGEATEVEAHRRPARVVLAPPPPSRPARQRPKKLQKRRRSSSAGVTSGDEAKPKKPPFDRFAMPTEEGMAKALECEIANEAGETIKFGDMLKERNHDKVVVIFLRHAWCGMCQQYVEALNRASLNLVSITGNMFADLGGRTTSRIAPLDVVLINSSNPALIGPYRERHHTPFPLYSDRSRKLYKALGMTRKTWDMGKDAEKGSYIVKSQMQNVTSSISAGVSLRKYPGSQTQLGGEFVFSHDRDTDSFKCLFVSRMHTTRAHAEIRDVFAAAGVELDEQDAASVYGA